MNFLQRSLAVFSNNPKTRIVSVLDIGSSKITCLIVKLIADENLSYLYGRTHRLEVLGFGCAVSAGIKAGVVVNMQEAENSIRQAVSAAERMCGVTIDSVIVGMSSTQTKIIHRREYVETANNEVRKADIDKALQRAISRDVPLDDCILNIRPLKYYLDNAIAVTDPVGMRSSQLGVEVQLLLSNINALRNLEACIGNACLGVEAVVVSSFASGLAALMEEEAKLGAVCIDLGAQTTSASVFLNGDFIHSESVPVGSDHITRDLAEVLHINLSEAEHLKLHKGYYLNDKFLNFDINPVDIYSETSIDQCSELMLSKIIAARVHETLELLFRRLYNANCGRALRRCVVLTGGGSLLPGLVEGVQQLVGGKVRLGRPLGVGGSADIVRSAAFSSVVGLVVYPQLMQLSNGAISGFHSNKYVMHSETENLDRSSLYRVGKWFKESFG